MTKAQKFPKLCPGRKIQGMSAILLPFFEDGQVDWNSFRRHVERTLDAGLIPAINMDTGFANLIDATTVAKVLEETKAVADGRSFVAGAMVKDQPGDAFDFDGYATAIDQIQDQGGLPIVFQSYGLAHGPDSQIVESYQRIGDHCDQFLAFELGQMFAPFGAIFSLDVYEQLMKIPSCIGAKHSSLQRQLEWDRLALRDRVRSDFRVLTGNDLAIDMVMYGSDYLLGLSTFAPDVFAKRDAYWESGDSRFYELNDVLQYLGFFAFRDPTPAYKHSAAMFLKLRGWVASSKTHPKSPSRSESDVEVLVEIARQLKLEVKQ
jgi:dihydrodipicolinate synthase/N-acetylneuraminate lyase